MQHILYLKHSAVSFLNLLKNISSAPSPTTVRMLSIDSTAVWLLSSSFLLFCISWRFESLKMPIAFKNMKGNIIIIRADSSQLKTNAMMRVEARDEAVRKKRPSLIPVICNEIRIFCLLLIRLHISVRLFLVYFYSSFIGIFQYHNYISDVIEAGFLLSS